MLLHVSDICGMNHIANFLLTFAEYIFDFAFLRNIISYVLHFLHVLASFPKEQFFFAFFAFFYMFVTCGE